MRWACDGTRSSTSSPTRWSYSTTRASRSTRAALRVSSSGSPGPAPTRLTLAARPAVSSVRASKRSGSFRALIVAATVRLISGCIVGSASDRVLEPVQGRLPRRGPTIRETRSKTRLPTTRRPRAAGDPGAASGANKRSETMNASQRRVIAVLLAALAGAAQAQTTQEKAQEKAQEMKGVTEPEIRYQAGASPLAGEPMYQSTNPKAPPMTQAEFDQGRKIYFERCAGCHGVLGKGADYLKVFIAYGSPAGMPNWQTSGELTEKEVDLMARYVQQDPPQPPEYGMKEMRATWKVIVPVGQRPTRKMNSYNIDNIFSTTLRDTGEVALIDGDTKKIINIVKTGYAVHISRLSASGRYVFVIGRDAEINMIELWMEKP